MKVKGSIKKHLARAAFLLLLVLSIRFLDRVLCVKSSKGIDQARAMYYQPRNSIDVVMMGSSHIHCDIDTGILWKNYGITSFDYSAAEQPLWCTYHYLREICKYQDPKVVVLDLYACAQFKDDYQYTWLAENLYGMRFSVNKLQMLYASCEPAYWSDYFPAFVSYHDRFSSLTKEDFLYPFTAPAQMRSFKGFTPYLDAEPQERPHLIETKSGGITVKSEQYLLRIIEYTKAHDIELFLIVTPYITTSADELVYNRIKEIASDYDVQFSSTNYDYDEIGLDFETDFYDGSHLNYWGALKFTEYLGKQLHERFTLQDHRGEAGYETWEENYQAIAAYVAEQMAGSDDNDKD